jgi:protein-S-isoprenylcysteine O-methyltransferase Ste14
VPIHECGTGTARGPRDQSTTTGQESARAKNLVPILYRYLFPSLWLAWAIYWWVSSRGTKPALRRESAASRFSYTWPLLVAAILFAVPDLPVPALRQRFIPRSAWTFALAAAVTGAGLLFTVWARRTLGSNWSGTVTIKQGHELVTTGPYAIVRHPIYSGLLLAFAGSAVAIGQWRAVLALAFAVPSFVHKLRIEERWMREKFGEAYGVYCERVPALVPFAR